MKIFSTCTTCHTLLMLTDLGQDQHPNCQTTFPTGDILTDAYLAAIETGDEIQIRQLEAALDQEDARPRPLGPAAVTYAEWGWPVFPLQPFEKTPYERSRGFKDATTDVDTVRKWWTKAPESTSSRRTAARQPAPTSPGPNCGTRDSSPMCTAWPPPPAAACTCSYPRPAAGT